MTSTKKNTFNADGGESPNLIHIWPMMICSECGEHRAMRVVRYMQQAGADVKYSPNLVCQNMPDNIKSLFYEAVQRTP